MRIGLDVGSTTLKCVVLNDQNEILFKKYERHLSRIVEKSVEMLREVEALFPDEQVLLSISGSAGMGLAERSGIPFVQEVYATRIAVNRLVPGTDAVRFFACSSCAKSCTCARRSSFVYCESSVCTQ